MTVLPVAKLVTNSGLALAHSRTRDVLLLGRYSLDTAVWLAAWYGDRGSVRFQTSLVSELSASTLLRLPDVAPHRAGGQARQAGPRRACRPGAVYVT